MLDEAVIVPVDVARVDELGLELAFVEEVSVAREARVLSVVEEVELESVKVLEVEVPEFELASVEEVSAFCELVHGPVTE